MARIEHHEIGAMPRRDGADPHGAVLIVTPRLGTLSPWASKATDIARNCGIAIRRVERITEYAGPHSPEPTELSSHTGQFFAALDNDLNISGAMGHLFDLIWESNKAVDQKALTQAQAAQLLADWQRINNVLALERDAAVIPAEVLTLVEQRQQARADKNWAMSDQLRDQIASLGWIVKDTKEGPKLTPR